METVSPAQALALGLKVDAAAVPLDVLQAVLNDPALLNDAATTRALPGLNAVVGLVATVEGDQITRIGTTCALVPFDGRQRCRTLALVPDSTASRTALWPPAPSSRLHRVCRPPSNRFTRHWPPGFYDPRFNIDGTLTRWRVPIRWYLLAPVLPLPTTALASRFEMLWGAQGEFRFQSITGLSLLERGGAIQ